MITFHRLYSQHVKKNENTTEQNTKINYCIDKKQLLYIYSLNQLAILSAILIVSAKTPCAVISAPAPAP